MVTEEELDKAISNFNDTQQEWESFPDKLNSAVDSLKWVSPVVWASVTRKRDEVQEKLAELFEKFKEAAEGIHAPFTFVQRKSDWNSIAAEVRSARTQQARPEVSLEGYWVGVAKDRYSASQRSQDQALATLETMCTNVAESFENLSDAAFELYSSIVDALTPLADSLASAITKIYTVALAPFGASDAADLVGQAVAALIRCITSVLDAVRKQMNVVADLKNVSDRPFGFPDDNWPKALGGTYADASLRDGTPRDWAVAG